MTEYKVIPHPKLKRDYKGKTIRTLVNLQNGYVSIPKGSIGVIVIQSPIGSEITFNPCSCCGMKARIRRIGMNDFEFIEEIGATNDN